MAEAANTSALWNAVETLVAAWAKDLEESLERDEEPDWVALARDMNVLTVMVQTLASASPPLPPELS